MRLYCILLCYAILFYNMILHYIMLYYIVSYYIILYYRSALMYTQKCFCGPRNSTP